MAVDSYDYDLDAITACALLVGRSGATEFELGYLHDDVPIEEAGWYAQARYKGTRVIEENYRSPAAAAMALARRLLTGAKCRCGKLVALDDDGAYSIGTTMVNGSTWPVEDQVAAGQCRWWRIGDYWEATCGVAL